MTQLTQPSTFAIRTSQPHNPKIAKELAFPTLNKVTDKSGYAYNIGLAKVAV